MAALPVRLSVPEPGLSFLRVLENLDDGSGACALLEHAREDDLIDGRNDVGMQPRESAVAAGGGNDRIDVAMRGERRQASQIDQRASIGLHVLAGDQLLAERGALIERGPLTAQGDTDESWSVGSVGSEGQPLDTKYAHTRRQ